MVSRGLTGMYEQFRAAKKSPIVTHVVKRCTVDPKADELLRLLEQE